MSNNYFDNVINEMKPFLDEQGFVSSAEGVFSTATHKIRVFYDENTLMYKLYLSIFSEENDEFGEESEINAWLFDDTQNAKDAESVGIDFVATLRKALGIKVKRAVASNSVELPTASKSGNMTVVGFAKKMLDVYPAIKDDYKEHISIYGNFLYINFFGEHLVPQLKNTFSSGSKKQVKKLYDVFEDAYLKGDRDTVNIMVALLCASAYKDDQITAVIREMLDVDKHFLQSFDNFLNVLPTNKKLFKALVK